ncbi:hypothetical protein EIN_508110 [Entamoeba invadens IP1]|uniref:TLDc domain-containing protein n=1 Tax=Entamoeba invadens IP1 TaxID=370355 RepID=A0A0A1UCH4_ENTIV|nr:hypothetical protein EIN_508110 [Entamoeba invadens IP1]ELP92860.1 hypothetical protein EIN_508110 [Entamoeba invadens IP1]|eukprot:XP_004259631.1 hypothetical protein EIN_508110 [Entamoeba invadens IP1]
MKSTNINNDIRELSYDINSLLDLIINKQAVYVEKYTIQLFGRKTNEDVDEAVTRVEGLYDQITEVETRREELVELGEVLYSICFEITEVTKKLVSGLKKDKQVLDTTTNSLVENMSKLEDEKYNQIVSCKQHGLALVTAQHNKKITQIESRKIRIQPTTTQKVPEIVYEWIGCKHMKTIFDSEVDGWNNKQRSIKRICKNRGNLVFIVTGKNGNQVGAALSYTPIDDVDYYETLQLRNRNGIYSGIKFILQIKGRPYYYASHDREMYFVRFNEYSFQFGHCGSVSCDKNSCRFRYESDSKLKLDEETFDVARVVIYQANFVSPWTDKGPLLPLSK